MKRFLCLILISLASQASEIGVIVDLANVPNLNQDLRLRVFDVARSMRRVFSVDESHIVLLHDEASKDIQCVNDTHAMGRQYNYAVLPIEPIDLNSDFTQTSPSVRFCTCDEAYERRSMVYAGLCAPSWSVTDLQNILTSKPSITRWLIVTAPGSSLLGLDTDVLMTLVQQGYVFYAMHVGNSPHSSFASTLARVTGGEVYAIEDNNDLNVATLTFDALANLAVWQEVLPKNSLQPTKNNFQALNQFAVYPGEQIFLTQFTQNTDYIPSHILGRHTQSFAFIAGQTQGYTARQEEALQSVSNFQSGAITTRVDKPGTFRSLGWASSWNPFATPVLEIQLQTPVSSLSVTAEIGASKFVLDCYDSGKNLKWSCILDYAKPGPFTLKVISTTSNQGLTNTHLHGFIAKNNQASDTPSPAINCESAATRRDWCNCERGFKMPNVDGGL